MTINKLVFSLVGTAALASSAFAGTAPSGKGAKNVAPEVAPAEQDLGLTLAVGYDTHYFFRGLNLAEDWISTSVDWTLPLAQNLRLDLGATYGSSDTAKVGKYDAGDASALVGFDVGNINYDRLQLSANVVATLGSVELGAGYRWYNNMGDLGNLAMEDSHEVGVNAAAKLGPLNVGVGAYRDLTSDGWYFEAAVNAEIKICDRVSLVPGANIGYADSYSYQGNLLGLGLRPEVDSFTAVTVSLALPIKLSKHATLTPYIAGNFPLNDLRKYAGVVPLQDNQVYGGVNLTVKF